MELRHLRYFVAVAEELNYRKASERLHVAQPALSSQIKDLEYEIGAQLLNRNTRGVRLTDAGAAFLPEARMILKHAQEASLMAREAAKGRRGRLNVGYFAPLLMGFMPASLKVFHEKYPEVDVGLVEMPLVDQLEALQSGQIHIGFTLGGGPPLPQGLKQVPVARSPIRAMINREHRLARASRIRLAELAREPLLCLQFKGAPSIHGEIMRRIFAARELKTGPIRPVEGAEAFRATIESGIGISFIAEIGALPRSRDLVLKTLADTGPDLFVELHAFWREDQNSRLAANFIAVLLKVAPGWKASRVVPRFTSGHRRHERV